MGAFGAVHASLAALRPCGRRRDALEEFTSGSRVASTSRLPYGSTSSGQEGNTLDFFLSCQLELR